jgi:predicted DNA-binding transcriptional regulator AlpA
VTKKLKRFLRFKQVKELMGDAPTATLYQQMKDGRFPRPMKLASGSRIRLWDEEEIIQHQAAMLAERDSGRVA